MFTASRVLVPHQRFTPHQRFFVQAIGASLILEIIRPNSPTASLFTKLLSEDTIAGEESYIDFLCYIHKEIQIGAAK